MKCQVLVHFVCPRKHRVRRPCSSSQAACRVCVEEDRQRKRIQERYAQLDAAREEKRLDYARQLAQCQAEIDHQRRILQDHREAENSAKALEQQKQNLVNLKTSAKNLERQQNSTPTSHASPASGSSNKKVNAEHEEQWSSAKRQWENAKRYEGAANDALDELMAMIGLEDLKDKFLAIKSEVDTAIRQGLNMSNKRFGASLLGNPGTGKRFTYAEMLSGLNADTHGQNNCRSVVCQVPYFCRSFAWMRICRNYRCSSRK